MTQDCSFSFVNQDFSIFLYIAHLLSIYSPGSDKNSSAKIFIGLLYIVPGYLPQL